MIISLWLLAAGTGMAGLSIWYARRLAIHREKHRQSIDEFYRASQSLLASPDDIPESVLGVIEALYRDVRNGFLPWRILWALVTGRVRTAAEAHPNAARKLNDDINSMGDELANLMRESVVYGMLAITFRSVVAGTILRRLALYATSAGRRVVTGSGEAESLYLHHRKHGPGDPDGAPAV